MSVLLIASTLALCPPPVPGEPPWQPPTAEQRADAIAHQPRIVYGQVIGNGGGMQRFKIHHVYRGDLEVGQVIGVLPSHGFNPPYCFGMMPPPFAQPGDYGIIAFADRPQLAWVDDAARDILFERGTIESARASRD